jgi:hypothetical protein
VTRILTTLLGLAALLLALAWKVHTGQADDGKQSVLGPGLYVFQTRIRESTCHDAEPDGYVLSYVAAIDGIPGSTNMEMQLVNTGHFTRWKLQIAGTGVVGDSRLGKAPDAPDSRFEVTLDRDRFKGTGARTYNGTLDGKPQRCRVNYDALLRRIDQ